MQAPFLLEEATMEVLLLPLQRRDLCAMRFVALVGTRRTKRREKWSN
nr:MAG TPA: hypothetical protein [Caudoviricetes sp.]